MQTTKLKPIPTIKRSSVTVDRTADVAVDGTDARDFCVGNYEMVTGRDKTITFWRKLRFHSFFCATLGNYKLAVSLLRKQTAGVTAEMIFVLMANKVQLQFLGDCGRIHKRGRFSERIGKIKIDANQLAPVP